MVPISNLCMHNLTCNRVRADGSESSEEVSNPVDEYWNLDEQIYEGLSTSVMNTTHTGTNCDVSPKGVV